MNVSSLVKGLTLLSLLALVFAIAPEYSPTVAYASEVADQQNQQDIQDSNTPVVVPKGSITVCKIVVNRDGHVITGSNATGTTFTINGVTPSPATSKGAPAGQIGNTIFTSPLVLNAKLLNASEGNDAQCATYSNLSIENGGYYYAQEQVTPVGSMAWETPSYNDQFTAAVQTLSDFFPFSAELYDADASNDESRNQNADGHIVLNAGKPNRTLVVLNRETAPQCNEAATQTIVSDTSTTQNAHASALVSFIHPAWTAVIAGASWIWGEDPIADPVNLVSETFTKTFTVTGTPTGASLDLAADNTYTVSVNGHAECADATEFNYNHVRTCTIPAGDLMAGGNALVVTVTNLPQSGGTAQTNPAGLLFKLTVHSNECQVPPPSDLCPNIEGVQATLPAGLVRNTDGQCVTPPPPVIDLCTNIDGVQGTVPEGKVISGGVCVNTPTGDGNGGGGGGGGGGGNPPHTDTAPPSGVGGGEDSLQNEVVRTSGGGGGGGGPISGPFAPSNGGGGNNGGLVLGAETQAPACGLLLRTYLRIGRQNDPVEMRKLKNFLNKTLGTHLTVDEVFDQATYDAVSDLQSQYWEDILAPWVAYGLPTAHTTTGYVYKTTQRKINLLYCATLVIPQPQLP